MLLRDQRPTSFLACEPSAFPPRALRAACPVQSLIHTVANTHSYMFMTSSPTPATVSMSSSPSMMFLNYAFSSPSITMNSPWSTPAAAFLSLFACESHGLFSFFVYHTAYARCVCFLPSSSYRPGSPKIL